MAIFLNKEKLVKIGDRGERAGLYKIAFLLNVHRNGTFQAS